MSFNKIAAALKPVLRHGSAALRAFPVAGTVTPSFSTVQLAAEAYRENR